MKIGVVADTHSRPLPKQMLRDFSSVDLIIHAGDFCSLNDYHAFKQIKDVKAVYGNMDEPGLRKKLPRRDIFQIEGIRCGLYHGEGPAAKVLDFVQQEFANDVLDVVIFGHSHQPFNQKILQTLYFNPGSPNDDILSPYCSYGILEVKGEKYTSKIVKVKS